MRETPNLCTPENRLCTPPDPRPERYRTCSNQASAPGQVGYGCTRPAGHPGPHAGTRVRVACGARHNYAAWTETWNADGTPYEGPLAYGNEEG